MSFFRQSLKNDIKKKIEEGVGNSYESSVRSTSSALERGLISAIEDGLPTSDEIVNKLTDVVYDLPKSGTKFVARIGVKWIYAALEPVIKLVVGKYSDVQFGSYEEKAERKMETSLKYLNTFLKGYAKSGNLLDSDYLLTQELEIDKLTGTDFEKQKKITEFYLSVYELSLSDYSPIKGIESWKGNKSESLEMLAYNLVEARRSLKDTIDFFETAKNHMHDNVSSSLGSSIFNTTPIKIKEFSETLDYIIGHKLFNSQQPSDSFKLVEMIKKIEDSSVVQIRLERKLEQEKNLSIISHDIGHFDYMHGKYDEVDKIKDIFSKALMERGEEFTFNKSKENSALVDSYYISVKNMALENPYGVLFMAIKEDRTDVIVVLNKLYYEEKKVFLDFNKKTGDSISLLQFAIREGALNSIDCLKDFGADIEVIPYDGGNLLFEIKYCKKGILFMNKMVEKLKGYGLSIESTNNSFSTPIIDAIGCNCYEAITSMIDNGANVMFENKKQISVMAKVKEKIDFSLNDRTKIIEKIYNKLDDLFLGLNDSIENDMGKIDLNNYFSTVKKAIKEDSIDFSQTEEAVKRIGDNINELLSFNEIKDSVLLDFKEIVVAVKKIKEINKEISFFKGINNFIEVKSSLQNITSLININKNPLKDIEEKRRVIKERMQSSDTGLKPNKLIMG